MREDTSKIRNTLAVMDLCKEDGHKQKSLDFFCIDCNKGLCTTCLIKDASEHIDHNIVDCQE